MSSNRMTANPAKPARYRRGKPLAEEHSSEGEEDLEEDEVSEEPKRAPPPKASSFPSDATKIASNLKKVDLSERRRQAVAEEAARVEAEKAVHAKKEEEGFVTEESDEEDGSDEASEEESGSEESSSEEEAPKVLLRPTFIRKDKRKDATAVPDTKTEDQIWAEEDARRKAKADAMIQEQLERNAAAAAAGKKNWDDDDDNLDADQVDDTDNLDPATELAAWKLRELRRVKREREVIELAEKEREELERRRNLSKEERDAEDRDFLETQKQEREGKGKMGYMQKYFHKGAFFQDDAKAEGLDRRDIMGSRYADDVQNRELLPQYMQIRDMTRLGRKGRTKYKDLKSEDTGRYGEFANGRGRGGGFGGDERFMPDRDGGRGVSGANTTQVGERRKAPEGAPEGPRQAEAKRNDKFQDPPPREDASTGRNRPRRSYSRSFSPPPRRDRYQNTRRRSYSRSPRPRSYSRSRSPPPRRNRRRRSYSHSRSRSPSRDRYRDNRGRGKRSPSPYRERDRDRDYGGGGGKRRRFDVR